MNELDALLDALADRIAERVVKRLSTGGLDGFIDQAGSPLGRRRHIEAVRSGVLPGVRIGRRYLARREDVERFVGAGSSSRSEGGAVAQADRLAAELGLIAKKKKK